MSALTHDDAVKSMPLGLGKIVAHVRLSVPAPKKYRDALMADFNAARGLDLSDDDRAARIRASHS